MGDELTRVPLPSPVRPTQHAMPDMTTAVFDVTPSTSTGGALSVMMRCVTSGKFIHPFMSLAPTNTRVVFSSVIVVRFSSANAVDYVEYFNDSASLANVGLDVASLCPPGGLKDGWKAVASGGGSRPSSSSAAGGGAHKSGSAVA